MWETLDPETLNPKPRRRVSEIWGSCQDYLGIVLRTPSQMLWIRLIFEILQDPNKLSLGTIVQQHAK